MQKVLIAILFIVTIMVTILFFNKPSSLPKVNKLSFNEEINITKKEPHTQMNTEEKKSTEQISKSTKSIVVEPETSTEDEQMLYELLSIEEAKLTTKPRKNIAPIEAISLTESNTEELKVNDTLTLPNIEGVDYTIVISSIVKNSDNSHSLTGQFKDEGIAYTTTITKSTQSSYITLSTPQGTYEIETENGVGYIYKTSDIRKHLQKPNVNDVIVLPIPKGNTH
jgi:putative lipase involved disintegration of autophagic bodies